MTSTCDSGVTARAKCDPSTDNMVPRRAAGLHLPRQQLGRHGGLTVRGELDPVLPAVGAEDTHVVGQGLLPKDQDREDVSAPSRLGRARVSERTVSFAKAGPKPLASSPMGSS